ncbi:MAG: hypothetical protein A2X08_13655 [Bacteroidetes bacterium GWA2_32_17]|nr:MAG: hypothetical protein A2X08_13655 [Bacteroidetes bacterium GWA2_32_17]
MKILFFIISFLLFPFVNIAQQYGNEWINYNQTYFKIPITQEGIYRISKQALENSGFDLGGIDTRNIQLFYRGKEQYIYLFGETNGTLAANGYIEFYAKGNDGWLDSLLFEPITDITNPYYSLYTDTAYYYLTSNNLLSGNKRVTVETDTDFTNPTYQTVPNCVVDVLEQNPQYYYGAENGPRYLKGEGWFDTYFGIDNINNSTIHSTTKLLNTPGHLTGITPSSLSISVASNSHYGHHLNVTLNSTQIFDTTFYGLTSVKKTYITTSSLSPTTSITFSCINDLNVSTDYIEIAYITLTYARDFAFNGLYAQNFRIKDSYGSKTLLQIEQFLSTNAVLWDLTNHKRIPVVYQNSKLNAIVPNSGNEKECYIISEDSVKYIPKLKKKNFVNYLPTVINTTDYVIITNNLLWTGATAYKDYRNLNNKYSAYCYDVEQLYDQFSYGIKKHPLAIKNFLKYISTPSNSNDSLIKYVFLIGKGIHSGTWSYWESFRKNTANFEVCLVPSYGNPSSDNMLTTKILTNNNTNEIPIGRIAATNNNEVGVYLSKVIEHENDSAAEWMKRVIHFGGGSTTEQQNTFAGYLSDYEAIISDTLFGGNVNTFLKTTSLPIQITVADTVRNLINDGTSLITFFGHGYTGGFDQNIEEPDVYNNIYKNPLLIANSCLTGDIFLPAPKKISERWIFEPQKGAIAFLATVDLGYANLLNIFTQELYKQFAYKNYMQSIGKCIRDGNITLFNNFGNSILNTCLEFTLHGDPAVALKTFYLPDLTINNSSISSVPQIVTSESDSFYVKTIVTNIGKAFVDTFALNITRTYPDGTTENYIDFVYGCYYKDTVLTKIPVNYLKGSGVNNFCVKVDAFDSIPELSETNNYACTNITIRSNDLFPIYPYEYAIFPNNTVTLKASTSYPFVGLQTYIFEIDTTDLFTYPDSGTVTQIGGVVEWQPPIVLTDSTVCFWRVSAVPQGSQPNAWKESSFIYIPGKTGWSQAHFFQYKKDGFQSIDYNRPNRTFDFVNAPKQLRVHDIGSANNDVEYNEISYFIGALYNHTSCGPGYAVLAVVIDPTTLIPWKSTEHGDLGHINNPCPTHGGPNNYFVFPADTSHLEKLATFIYNVPDSFYFFIYTFRSGNLQLWPQVAYQAFESLSSSPLDLGTIGNNIPYVFFCKKGNGASAVETYGATPDDTVDFKIDLPTNFTSGKVSSTLIGPARAWQTLHWLQYPLENPTDDSVHVEVKAYKQNNDSVSAIPFLLPPQYDIYDLYNYVDVATYPYLRFNLLTKDETLKTPSQLKRWQITYDEAPETAINPKKGYWFVNDTLQEGEIMTFSVATENVSRYDMDSLLVKYWVQNRNNQIINLPDGYRKLRKHPSGDVLIDTITFNTTGYAGLNHIWYEVNTVDTNTGKYAQLEQYHFNNIAEKPFYVSSDITNPLLDVTFDGIHILNGDIVSAKPYILVTLKDENKFLVLKDTSNFGIYITNKTTEIEQRIYFKNYTNPELLWTPAQLPKNSCKIEYLPVLADGKYQLRIQATDVSDNESGDVDYRIDFEVINKATVTNVYNYPNPFSTSTKFVFTLTGSEIPDDFRIQIFTITGKFVREIGLDELGNVHVGNNISQFAWNGTDMYGDKLANGVYFFKVIARLNSETIEHRATDADKFFKQGVGKMYILR